MRIGIESATRAVHRAVLATTSAACSERYDMQQPSVPRALKEHAGINGGELGSVFMRVSCLNATTQSICATHRLTRQSPPA
jgi:hypothetical protein